MSVNNGINPDELIKIWAPNFNVITIINNILTVAFGNTIYLEDA